MRNLDKFRPCLAAPISRPSDPEGQLEINLSKILFPVLASPKLDGIRCLTMDWSSIPGGLSTPVCRSLDRVPNHHVYEKLCMLPPGLDGELVTISPGDLLNKMDVPKTFHQIQSDIMSEQGMPIVRFMVFDDHINGLFTPYRIRLQRMMVKLADLPDWVIPLHQEHIEDVEHLKRYMGQCIADGYEGICFRHINAYYKYGRSTLRQQWLVKWKLFDTSEATIVGFEEEQKNLNVPVANALGYQERGRRQELLVGKRTLGAFIVQMGTEWVGPGKPPDWVEPVKFNIGIGLTAQQREDFWKQRDQLIGKLVMFKHQPYGQKEAPRIPVFVGIRDRRDT